MVPVGSLTCNRWNSINIELEPSGGFSFGGHHYQLNVRRGLLRLGSTRTT